MERDVMSVLRFFVNPILHSVFCKILIFSILTNYNILLQFFFLKHIRNFKNVLTFAVYNRIVFFKQNKPF